MTHGLREKTTPLSDAFWAFPPEETLRALRTSLQGLTSTQAHRRRTRFRTHHLASRKHPDAWPLLVAQFKSPIILLLIIAAGLSAVLGNPVDAGIILAIVFASGFLGFWQERGAAGAVAALYKLVQIRATALRDGRSQDLPVEDIVPGDVLLFNAGDAVPGDCLIVESRDLFVDEAVLTGETFPVEKSPGVLPAETVLSRRTNVLFMGTHVMSGTATAVVVHIGADTEFGLVSKRLQWRPPETEFERGVRRFGYLLLEMTLLLVIAIFAINVYSERPVLDAFLFSVALAVGLTPQLLPAIISVNLAHGAKDMARHKVIVKRLASIENFGSMTVLCSDKTGTLTEGVVKIHSAIDLDGHESGQIRRYAVLNAVHQTGFTNPIDVAIRADQTEDLAGYRKLDEEPYDFHRKRVSVLLAHDDRHVMITKGALPGVLSICSSAQTPDGNVVSIDAVRDQIQQRFHDLSGKGLRVLGIAIRDVQSDCRISRGHETDMVFVGFLVFFDPAKPGIAETLASLKRLGVSMKILTGDHHLVAAPLAQQVGVINPKLLTGSDLQQISDAALVKRAIETDLFTEVEPNQKERIILALRRAGQVVGYMGDGINDASAIHAADVGISTDGAVDVAKEAADIVLLEKDLGVLVEGIKEGRRTFANTLKYVFMATSANFGNMFSMAGVSLFLPFLPLLPKQILLTNFLTDIPEMTIATDRVDEELVERPRRWDIAFIRKFMLTFGFVSSVFDFLTFGVLLLVLNATMEQFRTGWFLESVISAVMIVLVIRSRRPLFRSQPGRALLLATLAIAAVTVALPFTPLGEAFGLTRLPVDYLVVLGLIVALYMATAEVAKHIFYKRIAW